MNSNITRGPDDLLTVREVAGVVGVSRATIYDWRSRKTGPPAIKVNGSVRFRRRDLQAWLDEHAEPSPVGAA